METSAPLTFHRFSRTAAECTCLLQLAEQWQIDQSFWAPMDLLQQVENRQAEIIYCQTSSPGPWLGCLVYHHAVDTAEIWYVYVHETRRRQGIAQRLLQAFLVATREDPELRNAFLEVRPSNHAAQQLYESAGFQLTHRRVRYYQDGEDALVYQRSLADKT